MSTVTVGDGRRTAWIGGIETTYVTRSELTGIMVADVEAARHGKLAQPKVVIASNGSVISRYHRDFAFRALIDAADIVDPDGMSLVLASRLLSARPLRERVATTDFFLDAAAVAEKEGTRFFLLGAKPGIADRAAAWLVWQFPKLHIAGTHSGYFDGDAVPRLCSIIRSSGTDVLWLGLGSPRQERFAIDHRKHLEGVAWIRTCGGLFDHYGGKTPRAPAWMQRCGLEWLHRARLEPRRLGLRYLTSNPVASYHLLTKTR